MVVYCSEYLQSLLLMENGKEWETSMNSDQICVIVYKNDAVLSFNFIMLFLKFRKNYP